MYIISKYIYNINILDHRYIFYIILIVLHKIIYFFHIRMKLNMFTLVSYILFIGLFSGLALGLFFGLQAIRLILKLISHKIIYYYKMG